MFKTQGIISAHTIVVLAIWETWIMTGDNTLLWMDICCRMSVHWACDGFVANLYHILRFAAKCIGAIHALSPNRFQHTTFANTYWLHEILFFLRWANIVARECEIATFHFDRQADHGYHDGLLPVLLEIQLAAMATRLFFLCSLVYDKLCLIF